MISKSAIGPSGPQYAGQTITYTLTLDISDYFAFNKISITDDISAGQVFQDNSSSYPPQLILPGQGPTGFSSFTVTYPVTPDPDSPPYLPTTQVVFQIPDYNMSIYYGSTYYHFPVLLELPARSILLPLHKYSVLLQRFRSFTQLFCKMNMIVRLER